MVYANVPYGALLLLAQIRRVETGREDPASYDTIYGHKEGKLKKRLTEFTVDEVIEAQRTWSKNHGSSAAGAYQFIRKTLVGLVAELGIKGSEKFRPALQDQLAYRLLLRRGYSKFIVGDIDVTAFGRQLAMEWASFPVLSDGKGAHRTVKRGQSYYAGDGLNKVLIAPEQVERLLNHVRQAATAPAAAPKPQPQPEPQTPAGGHPVEPYEDAVRGDDDTVREPRGGLLGLLIVLIIIGGIAWLIWASMSGVL